MSVDPVVVQEMDAAEEAVETQAGKIIDTVKIESSDRSEAVFLGRNISKLSPLVGNIMEDRIVRSLAAKETDHNLEWRRQDPYFPDAALFGADGDAKGAGFEVKAWYALSTELTGRFRESVNLLIGKDIRLLVVAWVMDHVIFGSPQVLGVLSVDAESVARQRDLHYHKPPHYLIVEPEDTTKRTVNLQQSNVNGYLLQGSPSSSARGILRSSPGRRAEPHTPEAQTLATELQNIDRYRLDTNFAKIDRVDQPEIEDFKATILATEHREKTITQWIETLHDLSSESAAKRRRAEAAVQALYDSANRWA